MVPSWLGHHDHKEETRQFKGNYRYDVALCKRLGGDSRPIGKGLTSKAAAQLSKICLTAYAGVDIVVGFDGVARTVDDPEDPGEEAKAKQAFDRWVQHMGRGCCE
jgi:hypothetical protein